MIESGIRGGIAAITHRHAKANNEYMFEPARETKFISYLDANNHYGWAMSKQLPTSRFEWMTDDELDDLKHQSCIFELTYCIRNIYTTFTLIILLLQNA